MRSLVLIVMIALLPLRMWAAEGMAVRMAVADAAVTSMAADDSMPEDCPMMAAAKAERGGEPDAPKPAAHCMACHLCAASACLPEFGSANLPAPTGPPASRSSSFASLAVAPDLRPPIS